MTEPGLRFPYLDRACDYERKKCFEVEIEADLERLLKRLVELAPVLDRLLTATDIDLALHTLSLMPRVLGIAVFIGRNNPGIYPALLINNRYGKDNNVIAWFDITYNTYLTVRAKEVNE